MTGRFADVAEADLAGLARIANRLLVGAPTLPHGVSPRRRRVGRGLEFFELRAHASGDAPRDIDWRASARLGRSLVRAYRDEAFATAWLCVDRSASMGFPTAAKWALTGRLTAALAYLLLCAGNRVGLLVFGDDAHVATPPVRGRSAYARLLRDLAAVAVTRGGGMSRLDGCSRFATRGALVVVVSDFLAPDFLRPGLGRLLRRGARLQALHITCEADAGLPPAEYTTLRDVESGATRRIRLTDAARAHAAARLRTLVDDLRAYCREHGIPLTHCDAEASWREVVLAHLRSLECIRA